MDHQTDSNISRRKWVKQFMLGSVASLTGPLWVRNVIASVSLATGPAVLKLKLTDYPVLATLGGSVQVKFSDILKAFTLNRVSPEQFVTLDSVCTHQGCQVGRYREDQPGIFLMRCPCHGSRYDIQGRVFRDSSGISTEPASDDLAQFATTYDAHLGVVTITIPNLALGIISISVLPQINGVRVKLDFAVSPFSIYEIYHQSELSVRAQRVMFAQTAGGVADQSTLMVDYNGQATVYVDSVGASGFFKVGMRLSEV